MVKGNESHALESVVHLGAPPGVLQVPFQSIRMILMISALSLIQYVLDGAVKFQ